METYAKRCTITVRRQTGNIETVDYTAATNGQFRVMNDKMFAQIQKQTKAAGRGEVLGYENERGEVKEYQMTAADKAQRDADRAYESGYKRVINASAAGEYHS